jgi:lambda family phage portal protein
MNERQKISHLARAGQAVGRFTDGALAPLFPGWAARRGQARLRIQAATIRGETMSYLSSAERSRTTADRATSTRSADQAFLSDIPVSSARARQVAANDPLGDSIVSGYRRHVVGTGIRLRASARDSEGGRLDDFNRALDEEWNHWAGSARLCDQERKKSLIEIQGLMTDEMVTVGAAFAILNYQPRADGELGLSVQLFEAEQLDNTRQWNGDTGNEIRGGVEVDAFNAPVAYWVWLKGTPMDAFRLQSPSERVPAERVHCLMRQRRVRQTRAYSRMQSVLSRMWNLQYYEEYEIVAKRMEACIGLCRDPNDPASGAGLGGMMPALPGTNAGKDSRQNPTMTMEPGMILDEKVTLLNPQRPGAQYEPFMRMSTNRIAAGSGLDGPTVSRDFSGNTYGGQRQGIAERDRETDPLQYLLMDLILREIWVTFVRLAILEGRVEAPEYFSDAKARRNYERFEWQPPAKPPIDEAKQAAADKINIDYRFDDRESIWQRNGEVWRDGLRRIAEQLDDADELQVPLPDGRPGNRSAPAINPAEPRPQPGETDKSPAPRSAQAPETSTDRLATEILAAAVRET